MGSECDKINILKGMIGINNFHFFEIQWFSSGYGRRKAWHLLGTCLVVISMIFNYIPPFMVNFKKYLTFSIHFTVKSLSKSLYVEFSDETRSDSRMASSLPYAFMPGIYLNFLIVQNL